MRGNAMPVRSRPVATAKTRSRPVNSFKLKSFRDLAALTPSKSFPDTNQLLVACFPQAIALQEIRGQRQEEPMACRMIGAKKEHDKRPIAYLQPSFGGCARLAGG